MPSETDPVLFTHEGKKKPIVVIVGCGFGGLQAALHLYKLDIELVLIDRTNHHLFQPLLYQVSTAALAPSDIASPIRALLGTQPNVSVILGEVDGVDKVGKTVCIKDTGVIPYDYLVLATGSAYAWFGHEEWADHAAVLKTLPDALQIRRRILEAFDWAETRSDPEARKALMTFVVVGGGPTGVELTGSLAELARATLKAEYRHIDPSKARIVLVDAAPRILGEFPEELSAYAKTTLEELGVEVMVNTPCECIDARGITLKGERIETANICWCAGTKAEPAADWVDAAKAKNGGVEVTGDCSIANHPEKLKGRLAGLAWALVHLLLLIGFRNRIMVFTNWAWAFFTYGRGSRLVVGKVHKMVEDEHLAGPERTLTKQHVALAE